MCSENGQSRNTGNVEQKTWNTDKQNKKHRKVRSWATKKNRVFL